MLLAGVAIIVGYLHSRLTISLPTYPRVDRAVWLTAIRGNLNTGHEFDDDVSRRGVIGRWLSPNERQALVEYLKTL